MSNSVGQIDLDLGINYSEFNQQLNSVSGKASGMVGGAFRKLGGIIAAAFAVGGIVNFGREAINLASDLQEVQNVVDVTFGNMSREIDAWSKSTLHGFGLSELSAKRYSSTLGAMMKSSGLAGTQMKDMSKKLTELSADMASFYNLSNDMAFEKIRSGISGETEPLKQLGINMSVANMEAFALSQGITKSYQAMNQAEQTLLRYNYLMSVTKDAQGDFARTSDSWANQVKLMGEQWKIFQGTMGAGFINILTPVIKGINFLIRKLQIAAEYFKAFTEMIFGNANAVTDTTGAAAATSDAAASMGDLGAATQDASKKVKKAGKDVKSSLASFDQLNMLTQSTGAAMADAANSADIAGKLGSVDLGSITTGEVDLGLDTGKLEAFKQSLNGVKEIANGVWRTLKNTFGPSIQTVLGELSPILARWKKQFVTMFDDIKTLGAPLANWVKTDLVPFWDQGVVMAGQVIAGLLDSALLVVDSIWKAIYPIIEKFTTEGLPRLTKYVMGVMGIFKNLFDVIKKIFDDIWTGAIDPFLQLLSTIVLDTLDIVFGAWDKWGTDIINGLLVTVDEIGSLWTNLWESFLQPFISNMLETLNSLWNDHLKGLVDEVVNFVGTLAMAAIDIFNKFIMPIVNYLVTSLGPTFSDIFSTVHEVIAIAYGIIADVAKGIIKALGGIINFITGVFTGDWKRAWDGVKAIFQGIWDALSGIVKGIIDALKTIITYLTDSFKTAWQSTWNGIKTFFSSIGQGIKITADNVIKFLTSIITYLSGKFKTGWESAWNGIKNFFSNIGSGIESGFKGTVNAVIRFLNSMINRINRFQVDIPDWIASLAGISGGTFGLNIPNIPELAKGGLVSAPTLAMVGEGKDQEAVLPLNNSVMGHLAGLIASQMGSSSGSKQESLLQRVIELLFMILEAIRSNDTETVLRIGETEFGRVAIKAINNTNRQAGKQLLNI